MCQQNVNLQSFVLKFQNDKNLEPNNLKQSFVQLGIDTEHPSKLHGTPKNSIKARIKNCRHSGGKE